MKDNEKLIKIVEENNLTLEQFMNNEEVMHIVEKWHTLAEDECGEKIDYEQYLKNCYELTQMK